MAESTSSRFAKPFVPGTFATPSVSNAESRPLAVRRNTLWTYVDPEGAIGVQRPDRKRNLPTESKAPPYTTLQWFVATTFTFFPSAEIMATRGLIASTMATLPCRPTETIWNVVVLK